MSYRLDKQTNEIVIDGWEKGIALSPYEGIGNIRNLNTSYYPGVAYVNYERKAATLNASGTFWYAGTHSTSVSNNAGWTFTAPPANPTMTNPVQKAVSPVGLIYILDDSGQVWKQNAVNSSTFDLLGNGGRFTTGSGGIAYWENYLVVFGNGVIEFCGDGTGDAGIISGNWNKTNYGSATNSIVFTTNFAGAPTHILASFDSYPAFQVNDIVQFTSTGTLPSPLSAGTDYYIITVADSYIIVSTTLGGSAVTLLDDGTGVHTIIDQSNILPIGNSTALSWSSSSVVGTTTVTIVNYTNPLSATITGNWVGATGLYELILGDGQTIPAQFTYGSSTITLLSPLIYVTTGTFDIQLLDPTVTFYRPYVSKVDGSLYFCNGQFIGRIATSTSPNITFNPALESSYTVSFGVFSIPEQFQDVSTDMVDLKSQLVVAGRQDIYTWDYVSAQTSSPSPVGEKIVGITNLLNNIYILAGIKGNIYVSNGYSAQLFYKLADYVSNVIDPIIYWGGLMTHRSRLFFQALIQNSSATNILAGIFSLMVSPSMTGESASGLVMDAQNSYGLVPPAGSLQNGVLIDNQAFSTGVDSYYSAWSNGPTSGGIDYNDNGVWGNNEPVIETDIIPLGSILNKQTLGEVQFKLDRQMVTGDTMSLYARASLTDSYTLIGTSTTAQLSENFPSNLAQSQWIQFMVQFTCAASGSSRIPLRELRIQLK